MDDSGTSLDQAFVPRRVSRKHASRQAACSQLWVCSPGSGCLGKHLAQEHEGREQEARPKVQLLSLTQFQRRKRVGWGGLKIALGPPGLCSMGFILWKDMDLFLCKVPSLIISVTIFFNFFNLFSYHSLLKCTRSGNHRNVFPIALSFPVYSRNIWYTSRGYFCSPRYNIYFIKHMFHVHRFPASERHQCSLSSYALTFEIIHNWTSECCSLIFQPQS